MAKPQPEDKSQGAEPVWSTELSPDSACSEGSTGSLEQQPDAGQSMQHLHTRSRTLAHMLFFAPSTSALPDSSLHFLFQTQTLSVRAALWAVCVWRMMMTETL